MTLANLSVLGTTLVRKDKLSKQHDGSAISSVTAFNRRGPMLSGAGDLLFLNLSIKHTEKHIES